MEQNVAVPVPSMVEEILEAVKRIPQEHVQNCTGEQLVDVPDSQIQKEMVQLNKTFHVIKMDLVKKFPEKSAETAEKNDDVKEFDEQLGKCFQLGVHNDSTIGAKIAEMLRPNSDQVPVGANLSAMKTLLFGLAALSAPCVGTLAGTDPVNRVTQLLTGRRRFGGSQS